MPTFSAIRFFAKDGKTYYGDAILPHGVTDISKAKQAKVITGEISGKYSVTQQVAEIRTLLSPLALEDVKTVRCLVLNYEQHARESNMPIPKFPILFYKPVTSLSGPTSTIPIHPLAQQGEGLDYECELVAIIDKPCTDVSESEALSIGNDVSHRDWQIKHGGGQWSLGKGFDGWAPWSPGIVSSSIIQDPQNLRISTKVNGVTMQDNNTSDMIFGVAKTIAGLTTLLHGDLIFTGTPQGVGMGRKPQVWLKDGDVVEVGLEGAGTCVNKVEFMEKTVAKL
ncbi:hypothetical protein HYALB_00002885 [Hymenoscyphus albidus]|uniref:Fumarylacetoacetase-like C-terminal domain-containing protein n=1 Tax=Hymenoscyphus albidus TaxID=595503 RepID=A0A9N9M2E9_9HELO|nr:hypothetical protein HYALB_00002885 [Hymenoscyphus albidus]